MIHAIIETVIMAYNYQELFNTKSYVFYFCFTAFPMVYSIFETKRLLVDFYRSLVKNQTLVESYKRVTG